MFGCLDGVGGGPGKGVCLANLIGRIRPCPQFGDKPQQTVSESVLDRPRGVGGGLPDRLRGLAGGVGLETAREPDQETKTQSREQRGTVTSPGKKRD